MLRLLDRHQKDWHANLARTIRRLIEAERDRRATGGGGSGWWPTTSTGARWRTRSATGCSAHGGLLALRRSRPARHAGRGTGDRELSRIHRAQVRTVDPGAVPAAGAPVARRLRPQGDGTQLAGRGPRDGRGDEARAGRPRHLLRRPLVEDVPLAGLLAPSYAEARRGLIDMKHASLVLRPGDPRKGQALSTSPSRLGRVKAPGHDTTTCLVVDRDGNLVAATPSGWSGVVAGDTGVWLGTRLQSFNLWPGHPNCIAPGKRPRITLTPTIVTRDRKPVLAVSVAGGDNQDMMTLQLLLNHIDFGLAPAESVRAPRFMSDHFVGSFRQAPPDLGGLRINPSIGQSVLDALALPRSQAEAQPHATGGRGDGDRHRSGFRALHRRRRPRARRHAAAY